MKRNFSALGRLWARTYGKEILRMPLGKMVAAANRCIEEDLVPYMDWIQQEEGLALLSAVQDAVQAEARAETEADTRMPELVGSEKMVRWALDIRRDAIGTARMLRKEALQRMDELTSIRLDDFTDGVLRKEIKARWFIDNRRELITFTPIVKDVLKHALNLLPASEAEAQAREEITIRSKIVTHDGVVEILERDGLMLVLYRNDPDYLRIMRACRLRWDPDQMGWRGRKEWEKVPVSEQMVRLAAVLIGEGFAVMMSDDAARAEARSLAGA